MERCWNVLFVFVFVLSVASGKDLHMKEYFIQKDSAQGLNFNIYDNYNTSNNERFTRHLQVEAATETIITHLFNEIKNRYHRKSNDPNLKKIMRNLKSRLKKYVHKKKRTKKARNTTERLRYV